MKGFDIILDERTRLDVPEEDLRWLLRKGRIQARTPCRSPGEKKWSQLSACLPHLKLKEEDAPIPSRRTPALIMALAGCLGLGYATFSGFWLHDYARKTGFTLPANREVAEIGQARLAPRPIPRDFARPQFVADMTPSAVFLPRSTQIPAAPPAPASVRANSPESAQSTKPARKLEEFTIPLDRWSTVNSSFGSFSVWVHDHGVLTITARINGGSPSRIEKVKGFETTGTNIALIHTLPGAGVYYVDRIAVESGYCVLKVIPEA